MHINDVLFLIPIPKQDYELSPCSCSVLSLPCPGQLFLYSNRTKNPIPDLAIPASFYGIPWFPSPPTHMSCVTYITVWPFFSSSF